MLARGEPVLAILTSYLGSCSAGRAAQAEWLKFLCTIPTVRVRRKVLEYFLRLFELVERHGSMWRVRSREAFIGNQHRAKLVELVDELTGELVELESDEREYCPAAQAGGLSARMHRAPRTLNRYRALLRLGRFLASSQPPSDASDAVRPRRPRSGDGRWAYAQHWLLRPPTPTQLQRWRGRTSTPLRQLDPSKWVFMNPTSPRPDELEQLAQLVELDKQGFIY